MKLPVRVFDPKVKQGFSTYLLHCSLATFVLFLMLTVEGAHLSKAIVIAAMASTAFVVFVTPIVILLPLVRSPMGTSFALLLAVHFRFATVLPSVKAY